MTIPLIGIHAGLGEVGGLLFLWVFVELLNPTTNRLKRAKVAALIGTVLLFASWMVGGYYYLKFYGSLVKPVIKDGPMPWAHSVVTETKEHVFLFLPLLSAVAYGLIAKHQLTLIKDRKLKVAILTLTALIVLITFAMAGFGYVMSSGFRSSLEAASL